MVPRPIDLNADMAERADEAGWAADAQLLEVVTSANVACGGHAGDAETMRRACAAAAALGVRVGAHPGYADREGFGRVELGLPVDEVLDQVAGQLEALEEAAGGEGAAVTHVKPHGALYHRAATDRELAAGLAGLIASTDRSLAVLTQPGSALAEEAAALGLSTAAEGFADRAYTSEGLLVPRGEAGSVLEPQEAVAQALMLAREGRLVSADGVAIEAVADSICVHGDTPGAIALAAQIRQALAGEGIEVRAFA